MELNAYGLWAAKQPTGKGSAAAAATAKRYIQVAGDFNLAKADGQENWSDLGKYTGTTDWVDSIVGNGNPGIEATPDELAHILWLHHGGEVTAAVAGPPAKTKHTYTPLPGMGHWCAFWKRLGISQIQRQRYNDCQVGQVVVEGSTGAKAVRVTPTVASLDPMEAVAADPVPALPTTVPFLFTEGAGAFTLDGVILKGQSQFSLTLNEDLQLDYSEKVTPYDLHPGNASVTIGITLFFDADGLAQYNTLVYGVANPAAGAKPLQTLSPLGSYSFYLKQKDNAGVLNGNEFKLTLPKVKWTLPDSPGPNPDGGAAEISLAGAMRKPAPGTADYTIDINCDSAAFTV